MSKKRWMVAYGEPWSRKDVSNLRTLARRKLPSWKVAEMLGRSAGATRFKAMKLGVSFRSINRRKKR